MNSRSLLRNPVLRSLVCVIFFSLYVASQSQSATPLEHAYPYSLEAVQQALQRIGGFGGGKLPVVDGFVVATQTELEHYQLPYYQYRVHLQPIDSNNTLVSIEARISALYTNSDPARSEYQSLVSSGRLESDLHQRLQQALRAKNSTAVPQPKPKSVTAPVKPSSSEPKTATQPAPSQEQLDAILSERQAIHDKTAALQSQINQLKAGDHIASNPSRFASVKRSGVGVMSRQNFGGPVLFRAQSEDEFEVVQIESGWAQVRLGSDATGYVQTEELNLPPGLETKSVTSASAPLPVRATTPDLGFSVTHEDVSVFSGDWARLKGKKALFVYAQPRGLLADLANEDAKLGYAKRIFDTRYHSLAQSNTDVEGVVVVFLGTRGGVAAATLSDIRQWLEGTLSDDAFVNHCSLDPATEFKAMRLN